MNLEHLKGYDGPTYFTIGVMLLSAISFIMLITAVIYERRRKPFRLKAGICCGYLLLALPFLFYFYRPVTVTFHLPVSEHQMTLVYHSQTNSTGGITQTRYELPRAAFAGLIGSLNQISLSRQIADWNRDVRGSVRYDLDSRMAESVPGGIGLEEMSLYVTPGGRYTCYLSASKDGRKQTFRIRDAAEIEAIIAELEHFWVRT